MRPSLPSWLRRRLLKAGYPSRVLRVAYNSAKAVEYDGAYAHCLHNRERENGRRKVIIDAVLMGGRLPGMGAPL